MPAVVLPKRWSVKPPMGVQINWGHPLAQGLTGVFLFNEGGGREPHDLTNLNQTGGWAPINVGHDLVWVPGNTGIALQDPDSVANWRSNNFLSAIVSDPISVVALANASLADSNTRDVIECSGEIRLQVNASNTWAWSPNGNGTQLSDTSTPLTLGEWAHLVGTGGSSCRTRLYKNGVLYEDLVSSAAPIGTVQLGICGSTQRFQGIVEYIYFYKRELQQSEVIQLYVDPYCFMQPQSPQRRYWFVPSVSPAVVTQAAAGMVQAPPVVRGGADSMMVL